MPGRAGEQPKIDDSEVVFVGYGVVAPEYGWDDFKGLDVRGKTLIMLVGDPPVPDPNDSSKLDPAMFKGRAMTYYGRWTYKYEIAAKLGAAAAILVHEDGPAGYPFSVVQGSWSRENFDIVASGSVAPAAGRAGQGLDRLADGQSTLPGGGPGPRGAQVGRRPPRLPAGRAERKGPFRHRGQGSPGAVA